MFASENKDRLKTKADEMNASRSEEEKTKEISYVVVPKAIPVI